MTGRAAHISCIIAILFTAAQPALAGEGPVTLFHTNDSHAAFLPNEATWRDDKALIGGFLALEYHLNRERATAPHSLYLDGGDFMTGNPISNVDYEGAKGGALVRLFDTIGLDAMALGNHEFDHPRENTLALMAMADFPILAANLRGPDGNLFAEEAYTIREVGDVRVGIIGLTTDDLGTAIGKSQFEGLQVTPAVEVLAELVPRIDAETDLIVVLSHEGIGTDREIARQIEGIDIIVGGHSHTRLERGEWVGDVLIVQAGSRFRYIGRVDMMVEGDKAVDVKCRLVPVWAEGATGSEEVASLIGRFEKSIDEEYGVVIAEASTRMRGSYHNESDLGNWLTDRVREYTGADVAYLNSGGIRKEIQAGDVRRLDIQEMLPFSNALCTFTCTGKELIEITAQNIAAGVTEEHGVLQSSGLQVTWGRSGDDVWVAEAYLTDTDGKIVSPVDVDATYTIATVDYVAVSQPDKYLGYQPSDVETFGAILTDAIMEGVERLGRIDPPEGRRMIQMKSSDPADSSPGSAG